MCENWLTGMRAQWRPHRTSPMRTVQPHLPHDGLRVHTHEPVAAKLQ